MVPLDVVEDAPKHSPNDVTADIPSAIVNIAGISLFTTNKGKDVFLIVFGLLLDISLRFDLNAPCFFYL